MSGYYAVYVDPGEVKIKFTHNGAFGTTLFQIEQGARKPVVAEKDHVYYLRLDATGIGGGEYKLQTIDEEKASNEIKDMKQMSSEFNIKNI